MEATLARTKMSQSTRSKLAARLRNRRLAMGLTQKDAALVIGVERDTYSRWEQARNFPDIDHLRAAQDAFDIHLTDLAARHSGINENEFEGVIQPLADKITKLEIQLSDLTEALKPRIEGLPARRPGRS